jgi:hypothetical protein
MSDDDDEAMTAAAALVAPVYARALHCTVVWLCRTVGLLQFEP